MGGERTILLELSRVASRFRLLVVVAAVVLLVLGAVKLPGWHGDALPETTPTMVEVQTEAPGLSGQEVEALVTVPLEQNLLAGVMGVNDVSSDSLPGLSSIQLHFQPGFDEYRARQLVQERLTQAFALPNVSHPPRMLPPVSTAGRVMMVGLSSRRLSQIELSVLARWTIVPRLLGLPGVANVSTYGQADRQLQVQVDPAQLAAHGMTLAQIIQTAGNSQLVTPLSYLEGSTPGAGGFLEGANQRLTIRHLLPFGTPHELGQVPVADVPGHQVALGSVTTIKEGHQPQLGAGSIRGHTGLVLVIQKLPSASVPAVTREVKAALDDLAPGLRGVRVDSSIYNASRYVTEAGTNQRGALLVGAVLAVLALVLLLGGVPRAFVALAAVAVSSVATALVLQALGYSFNALLALGLMVAAGVVVDEILAHAAPTGGREGGDTPLSAGFLVAIALVAIVPVFFAAGVTGRFLHPLALAYAVAVLSAVLTTAVLVPALSALLPLRAWPKAPWAGERWRLRVTRLQAALRGSYLRGLSRTLGLSIDVPLAICAAGLVALVLLSVVAVPDAPALRDRSLVAHVQGAPGMSLNELRRVTTRLSAGLLQVPGVADVGATLGRAVPTDQLVDANGGQLWITLRPEADYASAVAAVRQTVRQVPGVQTDLAPAAGSGETLVLAGGQHALTVRLYGNDYARLGRMALAVQRAMADTGQLHPARIELPPAQPTIEVQVDVGRAERAGITPGDARRAVATVVGGLIVGNFFEQQKVFDVVVMGVRPLRSDLSAIQGMLLDTAGGAHVRLRDIARVSVRRDPLDIRHEALSRYLDVTAAVSGDEGAARRSLATALRSLPYGLGTRAEVLVAPSDAGTSRGTFLLWLLAAAAVVVVLAQTVLGSWWLALLALLSLPVSLAGGLLVAFVGGDADSLGAYAGLFAVGVLSLRQALRMLGALRACHRRERGPVLPAVMEGAAATAGTLVRSAVVLWLLLAPFALMGGEPGGELLSAAAAVMLGALCSATLLNLFLLPLAYLRLAPAPPAPEPEGEELVPPASAVPSA